MSKAIYRMDFDCHRMGSLQGIFVADKEDVELLKSSKTEVYFGEVLGKHSEVYGHIDEGKVEMVTDDPMAIEIFEKFKLQTGYNPFTYKTLSNGITVGEYIQLLKEESKSSFPTGM